LVAVLLPFITGKHIYESIEKTDNSHESREISILMIKKARTRLKNFLQVKERIQNKDFQNQEEGATQKGQTIMKKQ
jgi:hypothetical protein